MASSAFIALGSNLPASGFQSPLETCGAAIGALIDSGIKIQQRSRWFLTRPVPQSGQPWFINGVVRVLTALDATDLLSALHEIETGYGRQRPGRWAARTLDLDLVAYANLVCDDPDLTLPHPRLSERLFVLRPLAEIAPQWRHPVSNRSAMALLAACPTGQTVYPVPPCFALDHGFRPGSD